MSRPTLNDTMDQLRRLFELYQQDKTREPHRGYPYTYERVSLILFFVIMTLRKVFLVQGSKAMVRESSRDAPRVGI